MAEQAQEVKRPPIDACTVCADWQDYADSLAQQLEQAEQAFRNETKMLHRVMGEKRDAELARQDAILLLSRVGAHLPLGGDLRAEVERFIESTLNPKLVRHGRDCPCTPCKAEDWDEIERGLRG